VIPLFPLNTVLFPEGPLPLRIFETRYVDMVRYCMRAGCPFGVILIRSGTEVGASGAAETCAIGTTARIIDFDSMPDGLLGITCVGERKFTVAKQWQQEDGLHQAEVEFAPPEEEIELPPEYSHLGELLEKVLPELGDVYNDVPKRFSNASWVGCRLAEILPIALPEKQYCLELTDPVARLARLNPMVRRSGDN
jgi:Lon protease-like protein